MEEAAAIPHELTGEEIASYLDMINPPKSPGRFQIILFIIVSLVFVGTSINVYHQGVYYAYTPPHHCKVDNMSLIPEEINPIDGTSKPSSCSMYSNRTANGTNGTLEVVSCQNGWTYDRSIFSETFITEFDLVCDQGSSLETIMTISNVLMGIMTPIVSYCADRFGRRKVFIITFTFDRIAGFALAFVPTLPLVSTAVCLLAIISSETIPLLIMYECFPMRYRGLSGTVLNLTFVLVMCMLPLTGYFIHECRSLIITWNVVAVVLGIFGFWLIPESLTWLLTHGRFDEAEKLMQRIAKFNKINISQPVLKKEALPMKKKDIPNGSGNIHSTSTGVTGLAGGVGEDAKKNVKNSEKSSFGKLIRSRTMIKITIIMSALYVVNNIAYSGLSFIAPYLTGNMHLNIFLMTIVELPAYIVSIYVVERLGRNKSTFGFMIICAIGLLLSMTEFINTEEKQTWIPIVTALIGKFGISGSYAVIYVSAPELFPTYLRSTGVAVCRFFEALGAVLVPYSSIYLVKIATWIPRVLYGILAILMAIPVFLLPETKGKPLPQTIKEIEEW